MLTFFSYFGGFCIALWANFLLLVSFFVVGFLGIIWNHLLFYFYFFLHKFYNFGLFWIPKQFKIKLNTCENKNHKKNIPRNKHHIVYWCSLSSHLVCSILVILVGSSRQHNGSISPRKSATLGNHQLSGLFRDHDDRMAQHVCLTNNISNAIASI